MQFLRRTISWLQASRQGGQHPFALVVSKDGIVISEAFNSSIPLGDPTQHAEMLAMAAACQKSPASEMEQAALCSSVEPCMMCVGGMAEGIGRLVYTLPEARLREMTSDHPENLTLSFPCREFLGRAKPQVAVIDPLLQDEAAAVHACFWHQKILFYV